LHSSLEIVDLSKQGANGLVTTKVTVFNQRSELVLSGEHKYLLKAS
jgi:acyl dehydratase